MGIGSYNTVAYQPDFNIEAGTFDGLIAGSTAAMSAVKMGTPGNPVLSRLCVSVTVDSETENLAIAGRWQVSQDKSTWLDVTNGPQNAASVAFVTGTSGADAAVTKAFAAPECVEAFNWCRFVFATAGATGGASDTWSGQYAARRLIHGAV